MFCDTFPCAGNIQDMGVVYNVCLDEMINDLTSCRKEGA